MEIKNSTQVTPLSPGKAEGPVADKTKETSTTAASRKVQSADKGVGGYNVAVSTEAQELTAARTKAFEIAKNTSPIREDRVAALKAQIQNGTYQIDAGNIADGILREAIREKLAVAE